MIQRGLCPGNGENRTRFSLESGMRLYSHRLNIKAGTRITSATNGFKRTVSISIAVT
jgi:hypothetical protein